MLPFSHLNPKIFDNLIDLEPQHSFQIEIVKVLKPENESHSVFAVAVANEHSGTDIIKLFEEGNWNGQPTTNEK